MRGALSMLAIAMAAHSCAAFAPAPALGLVRRLPAPSALRAPLAKLHMKLYTRSKDNLIRDRLKKSLEFAGSKVFPAGAGWQAASVFAGDLGLASTSLAFCLLVGIGNLLGVFIGHSFSTFWVKTFYKEAATNNLNNEMQVATLLGGAAFFSGAIHQPALNAMHGYGFGASFLGVGVACSFAFFFALRALRALLSWRMLAIVRSDYRNLKADAQQAIAFGVAAAFFVLTDVSFATNVFATLVGITPTIGSNLGLYLAGMTTSVGFMLAQIVTAGLPESRAWIDAYPKLTPGK